MELKDFIANTLIQIMQGVDSAQNEASKIDAWLNPNLSSHNSNHPLYFGSAMGVGMTKKPAFLIEFDVALQTESSESGKSGLGIFVAAFGAGAQAGTASSMAQQNRVKFVVPCALPFQLEKKVT